MCMHSDIYWIDHAHLEDMCPKYPPWIRFYPSLMPRVKHHPRKDYRIAINFRGVKFSCFSQILLEPQKLHPRNFTPSKFVHTVTGSCKVFISGSWLFSQRGQASQATRSPWPSINGSTVVLHCIGKRGSERCA